MAKKLAKKAESEQTGVDAPPPPPSKKLGDDVNWFGVKLGLGHASKFLVAFVADHGAGLLACFEFGSAFLLFIVCSFLFEVFKRFVCVLVEPVDGAGEVAAFLEGDLGLLAVEAHVDEGVEVAHGE